MQQRGLTEEDKRLLRERFAQLQKEGQEEEKQLVEVEEGELKSKKEKINEIVAEALSRVNNGEALEDVFEFCFEAGKRLG